MVYVSVHKGNLNHPAGKAAQDLYGKCGDRLHCLFLVIINNSNNYHSLDIYYMSCLVPEPSITTQPYEKVRVEGILATQHLNTHPVGGKSPTGRFLVGTGPLSLHRARRDQNSKSLPVSFLDIAFLLKLPNVCFCYLHPHTLLHKSVVSPHLTDETLRLRVQDLILFNFLFGFLIQLFTYLFRLHWVFTAAFLLWLWTVGTPLHCSARASRCSGCSRWGARALGTRVQ